MRKTVSLCLVILLCLSVGKLWHIAKDGFSILRTSVWPEVESIPLSAEAKKALSQTYHYLSRGHQCYAFVSEDGDYVIKIPRTDRYHLPFWVRAAPLLGNYREVMRENLARRERFLLESFRISYDELREQTALLAMHLGASHEEGTITIVDKLGRSYPLPLGKTAFVLQKKKPILMAEFQKAPPEEKKVVLRAFLECIAERARKGILNKDPSFIRNFGFDGKKAFQIDIGSFYRKEGVEGKEAYMKSIRETIGPVRDWLAGCDRDSLRELDLMLDQLYSEAM